MMKLQGLVQRKFRNVEEASAKQEAVPCSSAQPSATLTATSDATAPSSNNNTTDGATKKATSLASGFLSPSDGVQFTKRFASAACADADSSRSFGSRTRKSDVLVPSRLTNSFGSVAHWNRADDGSPSGRQNTKKQKLLVAKNGNGSNRSNENEDDDQSKRSNVTPTSLSSSSPTTIVTAPFQCNRQHSTFVRVGDLGLSDVGKFHVNVDCEKENGDIKMTDNNSSSSQKQQQQNSVANYHYASRDHVPPGMQPSNEMWICLDTGIPHAKPYQSTSPTHAIASPIAATAIQRLVSYAHEVTLNQSMWTPDSKTKAIINNHSTPTSSSWIPNTFELNSDGMTVETPLISSNEVLLWSGNFSHSYYGNDVPAIRAAGVIPMSPEDLVKLMVDSSRVKEYNKLSLGRKDLFTLNDNLNFDGTTQHQSSSSSSSSTVTTKQHEEIMAQAPNVRKILKFAIPAIGVWLCGPLLSLIDTSAVGVLSGTAQQAALNPAVAVTDYAALLIAFMYTGTTNLVAAAQSQDRNSADKPVTSKTLIGAMQLSTFVGAGLGAILFVFARPLLRAIIGVNDAISPAVFTAAMKYVRIRAIGMPAAAIIGSAQAACLGMQDIKSPLYVLAAAAIVNFFGDMFFVGSSHPWIGGAAGAAWATVFSQYAAVALFAKWLTSSAKKRMVASSSSSSSSSAPPSDSNNSAPGNVVNLSNAIMEMTGKNSEGESRRSKLKDEMASFSDGSATSQQAATAAAAESSQDNSKVAGRISNLFARSDKTASLAKGKRPFPFSKRKNDTPKKSTASEGSFTVRGFLKNKFTPLDLMKPPSKDILKDFSPYIMPVTSTQFGRVSGYVAMSHVVASSLGTISMAAQQIIVSLFYCLCPIADSLSLTAQSFVPAIAEHKPSHSRAMALRRTIVNFFKAGGLMGAAIVGAVLAIPLVSGFFTSDPVVVALVNSVVPLLVGFFIVHGWMCASEGLLLGQTDLGFLGKMYAVFSVAVPYLMLRVKNAALTGVRPANLTSVWKIFLGYQLFRVVTWVGRVAQLQRRTEQQAKIETVPSI
mmetsp:Transcript_2151/g.5395  ORF Transcript_2151/g.5395 Transcript_2151/m.5395 type:complete len:1046 (+) Transcript_2151:143-3280(+)